MELLEDPMYLALPREHPLARQASACAWRTSPRRPGCRPRARARARATSCAAATRPASSRNVSFESDDYQTVQGLVAAGVGVALIPELALSVVREDIAIRALSPAPPVRQVIAATPAGARLVPAAPAMLGILERAARQLESNGAPGRVGPGAPKCSLVNSANYSSPAASVKAVSMAAAITL